MSWSCRWLATCSGWLLPPPWTVSLRYGMPYCPTITLADRCSACSCPAAGCLHPPLNGRYRLPSIPHPVVSEKGWPSLDKTCFEASSFNLFVTAEIFFRMLAVHFVLDFYAELTQAWPGAKIMLCQSKHTLMRLNWTLFRWTRQNTMQILGRFRHCFRGTCGLNNLTCKSSAYF